MAKLAVIVDEDLRQSDLRRATACLEGAGHELVFLENQGTRRIRLDPAEVAGVVIPGAIPADRLRANHDRLLEAARDVWAEGKPVGAMSSRGWVVFESNPPHGQTAPSWPSVKRELLIIASELEREELDLEDEALSSWRPDDLEGFCLAFTDAVDRGPRGEPRPAWSTAELDRTERVYGPEPAEPGHPFD